VIYGRQFGAVIVPIHWKQHSTAEHGVRPQESLNEQLVEDADILVALFWHRLGSPTGEADSGTIEEIQRAHANGAYVGVLQCARDLPRTADLEQLAKLQAFYKEAAPISLMLEYRDAAELGRHIDAILSRAVATNSALAKAAAGSEHPAAEVWPRVESSEQVKTDSRGRVKTSRRWQLVLANTGTEPARNVRHRLEAENKGDNLPRLADDGSRALEVLPPGGEAAYGLVLHIGVAPQARCVVAWEDPTGERENTATLRFF
jgi:hypothetical protein